MLVKRIACFLFFGFLSFWDSAILSGMCRGSAMLLKLKTAFCNVGTSVVTSLREPIFFEHLIKLLLVLLLAREHQDFFVPVCPVLRTAFEKIATVIFVCSFLPFIGL